MASGSRVTRQSVRVGWRGGGGTRVVRVAAVVQASAVSIELVARGGGRTGRRVVCVELVEERPQLCVRAEHALAMLGGARLAHPPLDLPLEQGAQQSEVVPHDALEASGRPPQHVAHRVAQRRGADVVVVLARALLARRCALLLGIARLVEVGLGHHDDALDGDEHLQDGRARVACRRRHPPLAVPRAEQAEAHLAVRVQVGVEAHEAVARRLQVDQRRDVGVVLRHEQVELEEAQRVGRLRLVGVEHVGWARDEHLEHVD
eukprot:CAMPEP_0119061722 /NCGR_PEP_ID=MMETSP1178-20130426/5484_1 /TAXON_ID=33656 /ORGANISM="unid sp, Strain CCMP2000" /LENGTH=260 /DNA_ID=CAMNT_0007042955 /DNA_START=168 /DNA_END=948 /DNA_ORIENTATION=+